jgi:hypothetical protein
MEDHHKTKNVSDYGGAGRRYSEKSAENEPKLLNLKPVNHEGLILGSQLNNEMINTLKSEIFLGEAGQENQRFTLHFRNDSLQRLEILQLSEVGERQRADFIKGTS